MEDKHPIEKVLDAVVENPGHAVVGALVGQVIFPVPILGAALGAAIGGWIGQKNDPAQNQPPPVPEAPPERQVLNE